FKFGDPGLVVGFNAISAPEHASASALSIRVPSLESATRELMSSAHEITSALNKKIAQSASMMAAPELNFEFFLITSTSSHRRPAKRNDRLPGHGSITPADG